MKLQSRIIGLAFSIFLSAAGPSVFAAPATETKPTDAYFEKFQPVEAPTPSHLILKRGDRLAICGDSITEQRMYSRMMEDYLTMCVPQLEISVRQYGWGGERASGFLARMTNDCLRFKPTIATTCYGMNDHEYRVYEPRIGDSYRSNSLGIVESFKANGVRVIQGSPGCVGYRPGWNEGAKSDDLNASLCTLRNIGVEIAQKEKTGFADVFWPMLTGGFAAQQKYGTNYHIAGNDAVHPGWAGHTVMAYAFLKSMGLDGDIATFTVDLKKDKMKVSAGHKLISAKDGEFEIESSRYPFCPCSPSEPSAARYPVCGWDDESSHDSIRSGMALVPFNQELNRFTLVVKNGKADKYRVTWGYESRTFTREQLKGGINLVEQFPQNAFSEKFAAVDAAVAAKQAFETDEIKRVFRDAGKNPSMEQIAAHTDEVVAEAEKKHTALADAVRDAFVPVTHVIKVVPQ